MGSLSSSKSDKGSRSSSNEENDSNDAAYNKVADEEALTRKGMVASLETIIEDKKARLAMPIQIVVMVPPSPARTSTSGKNAIPVANNHYTGLPI